MNLNDLQKDIVNYNTRDNLDINPQSRHMDLYSEIGERSKEMLKSSDYGKSEVFRTIACRSQAKVISSELIKEFRRFRSISELAWLKMTLLEI